MTTWVVPGAPLEEGKGWRIWYSQPGHADFRPQPVTVLRNQQPEAAVEAWRILPDLPGLDRRMGLLTVTLQTPHPGELHDVHVPEAGLPEPFRWRSLPDKIGVEGFAFLLASCFWHDSDREGAYSAAVRQLTRQWSPAFKLLVGDQVYADWPSDKTPDFTGHPEVELYADRYAQYWGDPAYRETLLTSPNFFMCDDHEFWNDYPERQIHLSRSWPEFRDAYAKAAQVLYERYQQCANPGDKPWYWFTIPPVSFFVADSRSQRDFFREAPPAHFIQEPQWRDLERWARGLRGPGVLVLGQPLFQKDGDWRDHSLSNFTEDYGRLWSVIEGSLTGQNDHQRPHDILVLSGDIHTGRFGVGRRAGLEAPVGVPELIASPASMIRPGSKEPEEPDYKFTVRYGGRQSVWGVDRNEAAGVPFMTLHNNVAMVRLRPGTNGRVRFEQSLWRVRPYDARSWWDRMVGEAPLSGAVIPLFHSEIELR